jgi:hypothetical protein
MMSDSENSGCGEAFEEFSCDISESKNGSFINYSFDSIVFDTSRAGTYCDVIDDSVFQLRFFDIGFIRSS